LATHRVASVDLRTYVRENGPLPPHRAALLVAELADHLVAVHAAGTAYGTIAPETVRVGRDGSVWVPAVRPVDPKQPDESLAAADVRSTGAILAELLSGRAAGAPAALWAIVDTCAAPAPAQPTATELAERLRDAVRDLLLDPAPTPPAGRKPGARPWRVPSLAPAAPGGLRSGRRRTVLLVGAAIVAGVVLAGAGVLPLVAKGGSVRTARLANPSSASAGPAVATATPAPTPGADSGGSAATPQPAAPGVPPPATGAALEAAPSSPPDLPTSSATSPPTTTSPSPSFPRSSFSVSPSASGLPVVHGTLTWFNRSVGVSGVVSSRSPCASAVWTGFAGGTQIARYQTASRCGSIDVSQRLDASTVRGGITEVIIDLYVNGTRVARDTCVRQTHACTRA
jgi:serine/threonine protein kinase, bacterial